MGRWLHLPGAVVARLWHSCSRSTPTLVGRALAATAFVAVVAAGTTAAHGGGSGARGASVQVPLWLFLATGGGVVGASFLLTAFATDRGFVRRLHRPRHTIEVPGVEFLSGAVRTFGVMVLLFVIAVGVLGPDTPDRNAAVLVVWVTWWAGFTASAYLLGDLWPLVNPWRSLASILPSADRPYRWGGWPAVVGLLGLVWLEVVSPVASNPVLLVAVIVAYSGVTLAGAAWFGPIWFREADPVSRVFQAYGHVAPLYRDLSDGGIGARLPGSGLDDPVLDSADDVAFVVALLWVTSYDGLVATRPWRKLAETAIAAGTPPELLYPAVLVAGYVAFLGAFWLAASGGRRFANSRLDADLLARRYAPSLLAIAAGYHLAHYLGYLVMNVPAVMVTVTDPLSPGAVGVWPLPNWFGGVAVGAVLAGHLLAVWIAHAVAYELFPSRVQAIRSQYTLTAVIVAYTMTSLWIVTRPYAPTPFV